MSVVVLIEFKAAGRETLSIPVATQGVYGTEWVPLAEKLGLRWLPLFHTGTSVDVESLPAVVDEIRRLRAAVEVEPRRAALLERIDFILDALSRVNPDEIASIFIG
jgi:hypothetical protein